MAVSKKRLLGLRVWCGHATQVTIEPTFGKPRELWETVGRTLKIASVVRMYQGRYRLAFKCGRFRSPFCQQLCHVRIKRDSRARCGQLIWMGEKWS